MIARLGPRPLRPPGPSRASNAAGALAAAGLAFASLGCSPREPTGADHATPPPTASTTLAPAAAEPTAMSPTRDHEPTARAFVAELSRGDYDAAAARFDATMSAALPAPKLRATWEGLGQAVGGLERVGAARTDREGAYVVVRLRCEFARAALEAKLAFDAEGKVAGLFFTPPTAEYAPPSYARLDAVDEREVIVGAAPWALPGTMLLPKGAKAAPAVVFVHGSGPNDRDETVGANKPFRDLALGLGARGIASLRYDKRTKVHASKLAGDLSITVAEEAIDDAVAALDLLARTDGVDPARLFVVGHSLGGYLAPRIAERAPKLAGVVVLAGNTRDVLEMIPEQLAYLASLDGRRSGEEDAQSAELGRAVARVRAVLAGDAAKPGEVLLGAGAPYWRDLAGYDAAVRAKALGKPIFVAQGGRDYQVTTVDFEGWRRALDGQPRAVLRLYPALNHLLARGEGPSHPGEYEQRAEVDAALVEDLAGFIDGTK